MDNKIYVKVDGNPYQTHRGANLLEFLKSVNINIPTLCYHPKLSKTGACRLCLVKINKDDIIIACTQEITENMEVITSDEEIEYLRRSVFELLVDQLNTDCSTCQLDGLCELQELAKLRSSGSNLQYTFNISHFLF